MTAKSETGVPRAATILGAAGALPFVALAALSLYENTNVSLQAIEVLRLYGALILSFLGGIQWGLALAAPHSGKANPWRRYGLSVVPSLWAWAAMLASPFPGLIALAFGFALQLTYDLYTTRHGEAPAWFPRLRIPLSVIVIACLLLGAYGA